MRNGDADSADLAANAGAEERAAGDGLHGGNGRTTGRTEMSACRHSRSAVLTEDGHERFSDEELQLI
jgi:hypothetical protein